MIQTLQIFHRISRAATLLYDRNSDRLALDYDADWSSSNAGFSLSLSLPRAKVSHDDSTIRAFIRGLLPDNDAVLKSWGKRFHVSANNPFSLLSYVGEECAGALQFIRPERVPIILSGEQDELVRLTPKKLGQHFLELKRQELAIPLFDGEGRFSLAGAQSKTALHLKDAKWYLPKGAIPTTHILKPELEDFPSHGLNEHFCLSLSRQSGIPTATSSLEVVAGVNVIVVKRYDRKASPDGPVVRIHQEDLCQAVGCEPHLKYQSDGGPGVPAIIALLQRNSSSFDTDIDNFLRALALNWAIAGTDAHAKNYSLLHAPGGFVRLAPLYDLSSFLPYHVPKSRKTTMAMKYGHTYKLHEINRRQWEALAKDAKLKPAHVLSVVTAYLEKLRDEALPAAHREVAKKHGCEFLENLVSLIGKHTESCLKSLK